MHKRSPSLVPRSPAGVLRSLRLQRTRPRRQLRPGGAAPRHVVPARTRGERLRGAIPTNNTTPLTFRSTLRLDSRRVRAPLLLPLLCCHHCNFARFSRNFQALNVLVFDNELAAVEERVRTMAEAGVDAVIVQARSFHCGEFSLSIACPWNKEAPEGHALQVINL